LRRHAKKNKKRIAGISSALSKSLEDYSFPGNVRELENIIASAVLAEEGHQLTVSSAQKIDHPQGRIQSDQSEHFPTLSEVQQDHIVRALEQTKGNRTRAAKLLGIGLRTLQRKIKQFSINFSTPN